MRFWRYMIRLRKKLKSKCVNVMCHVYFCCIGSYHKNIVSRCFNIAIIVTFWICQLSFNMFLIKTEFPLPWLVLQLKRPAAASTGPTNTASSTPLSWSWETKETTVTSCRTIRSSPQPPRPGRPSNTSWSTHATTLAFTWTPLRPSPRRTREGRHVREVRQAGFI